MRSLINMAVASGLLTMAFSCTTEIETPGQVLANAKESALWCVDSTPGNEECSNDPEHISSEQACALWAGVLMKYCPYPNNGNPSSSSGGTCKPQANGGWCVATFFEQCSNNLDYTSSEKACNDWGGYLMNCCPEGFEKKYIQQFYCDWGYQYTGDQAGCQEVSSSADCGYRGDVLGKLVSSCASRRSDLLYCRWGGTSGAQYLNDYIGNCGTSTATCCGGCYPLVKPGENTAAWCEGQYGNPVPECPSTSWPTLPQCPSASL